MQRLKNGQLPLLPLIRGTLRFSKTRRPITLHHWKFLHLHMFQTCWLISEKISLQVGANRLLNAIQACKSSKSDDSWERRSISGDITWIFNEEYQVQSPVVYTSSDSQGWQNSSMWLLEKKYATPKYGRKMNGSYISERRKIDKSRNNRTLSRKAFL